MRNKVFDNTSSKAFFNKNCPLSGTDAPTVDYKNRTTCSMSSTIISFALYSHPFMLTSVVFE